MVNNLLLLSGRDIPLIQIQTVIHQPTIGEISQIGEKAYFAGCDLIRFNKNSLPSQDKSDLSKYSNFDIIMMMINDKSPKAKKDRKNLLDALQIIFPDYNVQIQKKVITLQRIDNQEEPIHEINSSNFSSFSEIVSQMMCLKDNAQTYNPGTRLATKVMDKIAKGKQRAAKGKPIEDINILWQYVSILSVGLGIDINSLMNYTVYQLFTEFERYQNKLNYDSYVQAKMAGAKDIKEVEHWMKDIYKDE